MNGHLEAIRERGDVSGVGDNVGVASHSSYMHYARTERKCLLHTTQSYLRGMANEPSDRLKKAREKAGYDSARAAAEAMGVSVSTYSQHENGIRGFPATKAERYGKFFRVAPEWLLYGKADGAKHAPLGPRLFVKGTVQAGAWLEAWEIDEDAWEVYTGRADVSTSPQQRFGLRVAGDSMDEIYPIGTILDCIAYDHDTVIPNGKRVIALRTKVDGTVEATVKEFWQTDDGVPWLRPRSTNPMYQAFRADEPDSPDIERIEIIGRVVASIRPE
ncbi:XRE family transcriptional regulator [Sphingomicrobium sp. XHP0235]|uniref:LexA family protein n=1 Tax=Sphingomicrobium aquimarinum TaxID=3133971 RepID=UPI0031FE98CC